MFGYEQRVSIYQLAGPAVAVVALGYPMVLLQAHSGQTCLLIDTGSFRRLGCTCDF